MQYCYIYWTIRSLSLWVNDPMDIDKIGMPLSRVQQLSFSIFSEYIQQHVKHASHMVLHDLQSSFN